jgi:hypothetical protein
MGLDSVKRNNEVQKPKPLPPPVKKQVPVAQLPKRNAPINARRGEVNNYANLIKAKIQTKEKEGNNLLAPTIAGANGASRTFTSTAEKVGFAPRTKESSTAARTVADTINKQVETGNLSTRFKKENPVTGAMIHKDGSITVTSSGGSDKTSKLYRDLQKPEVKSALQENLNKAFEGNKTIKRDASGNVEWRTGLNQTELNMRPSTKRDGRTIVDSGANSNTCAAGKGYQVGNKQNPVVAADEVWRKLPETKTNTDGSTTVSGKNPHTDPIKTNNADGRSMSPCEGCQTNAKTLTGGNVKTPGMTVSSSLRSGSVGAGIGATTETLSQLWENGGDVTKLDGGKIAQQTGLGAVTSVSGEIVERGATKVFTPLAEKAVQFGIGKGLLNVPTGATTANPLSQSLTQRVLGNSANLTTAESRLLSSNVGKLAGAGFAGGVIGAGVETVRQWDNLQNDQTAAKAVGSIAGQAAVGVAAGVAGAQIGAMIGTAIPIPGVGTVAGAAVGFAVGWALSATGADKAIASGVEKFASFTGLDKGVASLARGATETFNNVKDGVSSFFGGAANKLASVFG